MEITSVSGSESTANVRFTSSILNQEDFFKLLIAELQNQNPMNPMEDREFISQMAQFSTLEYISSLEKRVNALYQQLMDIAEYQESRFREMLLSRSVSLIGKEITAVEDDGQTTVTGTVESVRVKDGEVNLVVAGREILLENVVEAR